MKQNKIRPVKISFFLRRHRVATLHFFSGLSFCSLLTMRVRGIGYPVVFSLKCKQVRSERAVCVQAEPHPLSCQHAIVADMTLLG
jgi:hypothetical protein